MRGRLIGAVFTLTVVACGGSAATTATTAPAPGTTAAPQATTTTAGTPDGTTTTIAAEPCVEEVAEIDFDASADVTIPDGENRVYLCVQVPDTVTALRVEVPDPDGELTLYVGYPHLENVQQGGFEGIEFWTADDEGATKVVAMVPLTHSGGLLGEDTQDEFIRPGSYYIEVGGPAGAEFTVTVSEG